MAIFKPAVSNRQPIIVTTSQTVSTSGREIIAIHYLNTTAGAGQVDIKTGADSNQGIIMGAAAANGSDDFCPSQPIKCDKIIVTFTTGTGFVSILTN